MQWRATHLKQKSLVPWLAPLASITVAVAIHGIFQELLSEKPSILFCPAIIIGVIFGHRRSNILAAVYGLVAVYLLYFPKNPSPSNYVSLGVYIVTAIFVIGVKETIIETMARKVRVALRNMAVSENELKQIFDNAPSTLALLEGPDFIYRMVNPKHVEFTGFGPGALGEKFLDVYKSTNREVIHALLKKTYETGVRYDEKEFLISVKDPEKGMRDCYIDFSLQPLFNAEGRVYAVASQTFEVTGSVLARNVAEATKTAVANDRDNFLRWFRQTPQLVCITKGPDHRFEFVNDPQIKAIGFDSTGKTLLEAQPDSVEIHSLFDDVYKTGKTVDIKEMAITIGGNVRHFNVTLSARFNQEGQVDGVMALGEEVTAMVQNRISLERVAGLIEAMPSPFFALNNRWEVVYWNPSAVEVIGLSKEHVLGKVIWDVFPDLESSTFGDMYKRAREEQITLSFEAHYPHFNRWYQAYPFPFEDGIGVTFLDITARKTMELELEKSNLHLRSAKDEAERANSFKSAFLANMSHEIRTPLGAILGFADLLRDENLTLTQQKDYIDIVTRSGEQLSTIINDILDLSKVEAGFLHLEYAETSPDDIAADVISLLRLKANEQKLTLDYKPDETVPASLTTDALRLKQILLNLVGNAIKFTETGSIHVSSYGFKDPQGMEHVAFEISDTGIGVHETARTKIFDSFVQADGTLSRKYGGTGLGLALSRQLARALGGDLTLESTSDKGGSTFLVTIPDRHVLKSAAPAAPTAKMTANLTTELLPLHLRGVRVLVVDDSPENRHLIGILLTQAGASAEFAENGLTGLKRALAEPFDIVLMDIQMPVMDGYTATAQLRDSGYTRPIIALTAHAMSDVRKKCLDVGCSDYLTKPIKINDFLRTIARHVGQPTKSQPL